MPVEPRRTSQASEAGDDQERDPEHPVHGPENACLAQVDQAMERLSQVRATWVGEVGRGRRRRLEFLALVDAEGERGQRREVLQDTDLAFKLLDLTPDAGLARSRS